MKTYFNKLSNFMILMLSRFFKEDYGCMKSVRRLLFENIIVFSISLCHTLKTEKNIYFVLFKVVVSIGT